MEQPATTQPTERPGTERLLGTQVTTTDDGQVHIRIHTRASDGTLYEGLLVIEQEYIADGLRRQILAAIPERPRAHVDLAEIRRRSDYVFFG